MKKSFLFLLVIMFSFQGFAQTYNSQGFRGYDFGIGIRGGFTSGITFKMTRDGGSSAIEGILGFGFRSFRIVGLYEIQTQAFDVEGLNWYYGVGGHVAFYNFGSNGDWRWNGFGWEKQSVSGGSNFTNSGTGFGIDGILGIEYQIEEIPFTVGVDIKPSVEFNTLGYFPFMFWDTAVSIRYVW